MRKLLAILSVPPLALGISACSNDGEEVSQPASNTIQSITPSTTPSNPVETTTPSATNSESPTTRAQTPTVDQLVGTANRAHEHGVYLNPDTGDYYYCNTTQTTWDGTAPGECEGPYSYESASKKFETVTLEWYNDSLHSLDMPAPQDADFYYCSGDGVAMYTDGNEHPYPGCAQPPAPIQEPSPWVSGQIEWQNCIDAGNSTEYCRETLN